MTQYTPIVETFELPSKGKIYNNVSSLVTLRSMTTEEEMRRQGPNKDTYKVMADIIDSCITQSIGISSYDMCLADYQFLLHRLRVVTYGDEYSLNTRCPHCLTMNDVTINLSELPVKEIDLQNIDKLMEFTLPTTKANIKICMQTPRIIDQINAKVKQANNSKEDLTFLQTLLHMIDTVDGKELDVIELEKFVRSLPMQDTNFIVKHAQKLIESFGIDTKSTSQCPICGLDYTVPFRITGDFFGPNIDI